MPTAADIAQFGTNPTSGTTGISINFNTTTNAGTQTTGNRIEDVGAIEITSSRSNNLLIGNSTTAAGASGTLRLLGTTVNSVSNVVLRNNSAGTLTIQNTQGSGNQTMSVALGNATDNIVNIDGTGGITISSVIKDASGAAHLTLGGGGTGTGILTLSGANIYTGGTTVAAGQLRVSNPAGSATGPSTAGVTVGNNTGIATLSGIGTIAGLVTTATTGANVAHIAPGANAGITNIGTAGNLQLNGGLTIGTGTLFDLDLASTAGGTNDLITFGGSGALTLASNFTINYNLLTAGILETTVNTNYTLFSGASNALDLTGVTITSLGLGAYTPTYTVASGALLVSFTNAAAPTPNYFDTNGSVAGIGINGGTALWDTTSTHWTPVVAGTGTSKVFDPTQTAYFGASGGGTSGAVTVDAGGVSANFGIEFDTTGYTVSGGAIALGGTTPTITVLTAGDSATISSALSGSTGLTKAGAGTLVLDGVNGFSGTVNLNAGTLSVGSDGNLGTSTNPLVFNGGTLLTTAGIAAARTITVTAVTGGTFNTNGFDSSTTSTTTINGPFTKSGAGELALNGFVNFGAGAALTVSGGALALGQLSGTSTMFGGAVLNGNLILKNPIRLNLNGAYTGTGQIQIEKSLTSLANTGSGIVITIDNNIVLNSTNTLGAFVTNLGPLSSGSITVNGVISGNSDLNIAGGNAGVIGGGTGNLTLNAQNTYTGATTLNLAGANTTSTVKLGINNALPPTTALSFNTNASASGTTLDLNGHHQTVSSLAYGNGNGAANPLKFIVTNNSALTDSTLTIDGSVTPATAFTGKLSDGSNGFKLKVVKAGTNAISFKSGLTEFSALEVHGGTLNLGTALNTPAGSTIDVTPTSGTASLNIGASQTLASLTIGAGGVVTLTSTLPPPAPEFAGDDFPGGGAAAPVPEPGSAGLLLGGILTLLGLRRRE